MSEIMGAKLTIFHYYLNVWQWFSKMSQSVHINKYKLGKKPILRHHNVLTHSPMKTHISTSLVTSPFLRRLKEMDTENVIKTDVVFRTINGSFLLCAILHL